MSLFYNAEIKYLHIETIKVVNERAWRNQTNWYQLLSFITKTQKLNVIVYHQELLTLKAMPQIKSQNQSWTLDCEEETFYTLHKELLEYII